MKWVKQNLIVIIFLCIFIVLLGGGAWLGWDARGKLKAVEDALAEKRGTLDEMRRSKPYPSKENTEVLQKEFQGLTKQYEALHEAMSKNEVSLPDKLDLYSFQPSLYKMWDRLQQSAANANVKLPEKFTFGFSRYSVTAPCAGTDVKAEECAKRLRLLMKELLIVEKVTDLLISNRVEEIRSVKRAEVEPTPSADALGALAEQGPSPLYKTMPFEFQFFCGSQALRDVLNNLSRSEPPYLFIVRSLTVSTEGVQVQSQPSSTVNPFFGSPTAPPVMPFMSPQAQPFAVASSPSGTMRRRLAVTVRFDLVEFPQSQKGK